MFFWSISHHLSILKNVFRQIVWPLMLILSIYCYFFGMKLQHPVLAFNFAYFGLAGSLYFLERAMPYESAWLFSDGQILNDIGHTILTKGLSQLLTTSATLFGLAEFGPSTSFGFWPESWHLFFQVCLALMIAEFGLYWAHRLAHQWWPAWCWHAVHHSVTKLWFVNTGRFHLFDSLWKSAFALSLALLAGAPKDIVMWVLVITAFIGFLTHCNVDMRCGWLNWIFNTPQLHRWHHSQVLEEGNKNYGENLIIWDIVFGTRFLPSNRKPPLDIGCADPVPKKFLGQIAYPVTAWLKRQKM
jgi:sterol desaturase/sphingolipid hydroxylase (fatty acid hydroxylase superfamily)